MRNKNIFVKYWLEQIKDVKMKSLGLGKKFFNLKIFINKKDFSKMVDRLEKLRTRATGNGVTQCLLCSTEFGLLASKSYAAMCSDCRKV